MSSHTVFQQSQPFFKLMSMLVEFVGGPPGMPPFTQLILQRFWEVRHTNSLSNSCCHLAQLMLKENDRFI